LQLLEQLFLRHMEAMEAEALEVVALAVAVAAELVRVLFI
jgi:hypothetical protein